MGETAGEYEEASVGATEVADQEEGEDPTCSIESCGFGGVLRIPIVLESGEVLWRIFCAECEMTFCVVGFAVCF